MFNALKNIEITSYQHEHRYQSAVQTDHGVTFSATIVVASS